MVQQVEPENELHTTRAMVEALRMGVVPAGQTHRYTVGRDLAIRQVRSDLARASTTGAVRAFIGDYGSGKTHLLAFIEDEARSRGYVTTRVMLNPSDAAPSNPQRVFRGLMRSLTLPDESGHSHGLEALLERALQNPQALAAFGAGSLKNTARPAEYLIDGRHLYLTPALQYAQAIWKKMQKDGESAGLESAWETLVEWLGGASEDSSSVVQQEVTAAVGRAHGRLYSLRDYRPWARIYGYLLSGIAALAQACGYAGLCVLLDEAEFYSVLDASNRRYAETLMRAFSYAAAAGVTPEDLPFGKDDLSEGGAGVLQQTPARYGTGAGLYTVFMMTPDADGLAVLERAVPVALHSRLEPLHAEHLMELATRVCALYRTAYPDGAWKDGFDIALSRVVAVLLQKQRVETPRQAMKFIVEMLDIQRHHPDRLPLVVKTLVQSLQGPTGP
jgi:hypothetical protein